MTVDLRNGDWRDVLSGFECDAVITDPPYGSRTHQGQRHGRRGFQGADDDQWCANKGLGYGSLTAADVAEFCEFWSGRCRGWICAMTSHDLVPAYTDALEARGRYVFAPLPCVLRGMNIRLAGDGPSSWCVWLVVSRPRKPPYSKWGTLPGAYVGSPGQGVERATRPIAGTKPLWLMRAIVRDYTRAGDVVIDPYAGTGTTLLAARAEGRRGVGAEVDPETYAAACRRLGRPFNLELF